VRWVCVEDGPRDPATGRRNQIKRRGKTQREAKKRVQDAIRSLNEDGMDTSTIKIMTFERVAEKWMETYIATGVKRGSVRVREKEIKILNKYFAKAPISKITHFMYQNVLNDLAKEEYAVNTMNGVNTCAGMIFKYAKRNKLIKDNPREDAVVPKKRKTIESVKDNQIENKYMEGKELDEFLTAVLNHGLELDKERFFTLAFTGMRPGELIALQKQDIEFENKTVHIAKTLYNENNNMKDYTLTLPKTDGSYRVIDMDDKIMTLLKRLIHKNDVHKMKYQKFVDDYHDMDFVFQRNNGYPFVTKNIADRMQRILTYTDIKKKLTPHSFRHTHISMMTEAGVELPTIMKKVGHDDPDTTLKIYTHVTDKMKLRSVEKVTNLHSDLLDKIVFQN